MLTLHPSGSALPHSPLAPAQGSQMWVCFWKHWGHCIHPTPWAALPSWGGSVTDMQLLAPRLGGHVWLGSQSS